MNRDLSRKDLAQLLDVSVDQVRKNEDRWGLRPTRREYNARFIRYRRTLAMQTLRERGLIDPECVVNGSLLKWKVTGELLGVHRDFEALVGNAEHVHFAIDRSLGGNWSAAEAMLRIVGSKPSSAHVTTFAHSAGGFLAALCPGRRTMSAEATLMLHAGQAVCVGNARQLRQRAAELEAYEEKFARRLADRTGQRLGFCKRMLSGPDYHFTATEAQRHGLVDAVTP